MGHVVDLVPTLLELAGATPDALPVGAPPFPGRSLASAFAKSGAARREAVFFHHAGNRALRVGDWKIVSARDNGDVWSLYNLARDRAESRDLTLQQPKRAREMAALAAVGGRIPQAGGQG